MTIPININKLLIDGDIILYTIAYVVENFNNPVTICKRIDNYLLKIFKTINNSTEYMLFLSGRNNFRKNIYPEYKKNRSSSKKPKWYDLLRNHLIEKWNAIELNEIEADDALSIVQHYYNNSEYQSTIIISKDKDLLQVPGWHYKIPSKSTQMPLVLNISKEDAFQLLMQQSLMGDAIDNIPGVKGIGVVKSKQLLLTTEPYQWFDIIIQKYVECYGTSGANIFWINYNLVKLLTNPGEQFRIPEFNNLNSDLINSTISNDTKQNNNLFTSSN